MSRGCGTILPTLLASLITCWLMPPVVKDYARKTLWYYASGEFWTTIDVIWSFRFLHTCTPAQLIPQILFWQVSAAMRSWQREG
jgi:hypothetical protein